MTKDEVIQYLLDLGFVDNYTTKLLHYRDEDIIQEIWLMILEISDSKWELLQTQGSDTIVRFVSGLIYRQVMSGTSRVFYKYKNHNNREKIVDVSEWRNLQQMMIKKGLVQEVPEDRM